MIVRLFDYLLLGLSSVLNYKLRSVLTTLGVVLGISALLSMLAVGEGARRQILAEMDRMGLRNVIVSSRRPQAKAVERSDAGRRGVFSYGLTFKDLKRCKDTIPGLVRALPVQEIYRPVVLGGRKTNARVLAVTTDYFSTFPARVERGRGLCDLDARRRMRVCVLVTPMPVETFFGRDPLRATLSVGDHLFRVVGIVTPEAEVLEREDKGDPGRDAAGQAGSNLLRIFIPYETALARYGTMRFRYEQGTFERFMLELDRIVLECADPLVAVKPLGAILEKGHKEVDYEITVPVELLHQRQQTQETFNLVMLLVAGLTLLVGGVGIVNIMLVSVAERTKEIGIRRALGARRQDIMLQMLVETVALTLTGGVLGVLVGFAGVYAIGAYTGWPVLVTPWAVLGSLLVSIAAGVFFGLYPARHAASISPVTALRYE